MFYSTHYVAPMLMGFFHSFRSYLIFSLSLRPALNHTQGGLKQNILTKAFSGRFGFDSVRTSQLLMISQKQSSGNAPGNVYISAYIHFHSAWGFQRCSFRLIGQCEGLYTVERVTELAPRLFL